MGLLARMGVFCLMGLAIALARLVEVELMPQTIEVSPAEATESPPPDAVPAMAESQAVPPPQESPPRQGDQLTLRPGERVYTVRKGDTLGTISRRMYRTTRYWHLIQEANKETIPSPKRMRPGVRLRIPPRPR